METLVVDESITSFTSLWKTVMLRPCKCSLLQV